MTEPTYPPVIAILGPTASGKSALALDLATRLDGVIINVDSMQVYRDLRILTARPDDDDLARAPHRLYGFQAADTPCSAADWRTRALVEIAAAGVVRALPPSWPREPQLDARSAGLLDPDGTLGHRDLPGI